MKGGVLLLTTVALIAASRHAAGCEIVGFNATPDTARDRAVRVVATVIGYGIATNPVPGVESAPNLRVRFDEAVAGDLPIGPGEVTVLKYGPVVERSANDWSSFFWRAPGPSSASRNRAVASRPGRASSSR